MDPERLAEELIPRLAVDGLTGATGISNHAVNGKVREQAGDAVADVLAWAVNWFETHPEVPEE